MTAWHEEDLFWERIFMFGEHQWQIAPEEVSAAISFLGIPPGAKILDLPLWSR